MTIFTSKYHLYQYGTCNIEIGGSAISPAKCVRNLGVNMDQHLSMVQQVTTVCGTCNYHLYRLASVRQFLTTDATRSAVQALITSRLDYCNALLAGMPAAKHTYKIAGTVFKCLHDLAPSYLVELLIIHQRDSPLRQVDTHQFCQPVAKKSVGQQAFSVTGPRVWNTLLNCTFVK